jgi:xylonate dehydratase
VDPDSVIMSSAKAGERGLTPTVCFPRGNLAPEGAVIKATAIDPLVVGSDGVYRHEGPAKVFTSEKAAVAAIKDGRVAAGDVLVLCGVGPMGTGMEEIYQVTAALKYLDWGKHVAVLTDARFSGVSTGACVGHISPEALAGGPLGRLRDGDRLRVVVDRVRLEGAIDCLGSDGTPECGSRLLADREPHPGLAPDPRLPEDTKLWAALQQASGGVWGGCVYDSEMIQDRLNGTRTANGHRGAI